jgi:2-dehydro-3-deoxygalactonokinase
MDANSTVISEMISDQGMGSLTPAEFEPALVGLVKQYLDPHRRTHVIACGMVGARQGWVEAPYRRVPCAASSVGKTVQPPVTDARLDVLIVPGVSQDAPADVMRGEETQIAGFLADTPDFEGVLCLPGTHTKWAHISAGEIVSFRTFMTGELFSLLSQQSVLRHGLREAGWDQPAFSDGIGDALAHPQRVSSDLFSLRAAALLHGLSASAARSRLSGLLIGLELGGARPYWLGQKVVVIGARDLGAHYLTALTQMGTEVAAVSGDDVTLRGLKDVYQKLGI